MREIEGSICAPRGFTAAAVFCGIKRLGTGKGSEKGRKADLALIVSDVPATIAGTFTINSMRAAPVELCAERVRRGGARAIVVNSGNANACTGDRGMRDARRMAALAASAVAAVSGSRNPHPSAPIDRRYRRMNANDVLVASTGRIGVPMPMSNVASGIVAAARNLESSVRAAAGVAEAIRTS